MSAVHVSVIQAGRVFKRVESDSVGVFSLELPAGQYQLVVTAPDFKPYAQDLRVVANMPDLTVTLELEGVKTAIDVTSSSDKVVVDAALSLDARVITAEQLAHWRTWLGRTEQRSDWIAAAPLNAWAAMLDRDDPEASPGSDVPPLAHWLYFLPVARQSQIGSDGHPLRGGFLPPIPLPRRMWAGGRLAFHHALRVAA